MYKKEVKNLSKNKIAITLGIVCMILTIAIVIQINTIKGTNETVGQTLAEDELRDEVLRMKERYDNAYSSLENAEKELAQIREQATQNDGSSAEK